MRLQLNTRSSGGGKSAPGDRVCDGCFNLLTSEAIARNAALAKAKKDMQQQLEKDEQERRNEVTQGGSSGNPKVAGHDGEKINDIKDSLSATGEALKERGEKLATLADKSENLEQVYKSILNFPICLRLS